MPDKRKYLPQGVPPFPDRPAVVWQQPPMAPRSNFLWQPAAGEYRPTSEDLQDLRSNPSLFELETLLDGRVKVNRKFDNYYFFIPKGFNLQTY